MGGLEVTGRNLPGNHMATFRLAQMLMLILLPCLQEEARQQYCDLIGSLVDAEGGVAAAGSGTAAYQMLEVTMEDNITTIRLNRPEKKNAINTQVRVSELVRVSLAVKLRRTYHHPHQWLCPNLGSTSFEVHRLRF